MIRWGARQIERVLAVIGLMALIYWLAFDYSCILSNSMSPTLLGTSYKDGDRVLTERISYWFRKPRRWEVITIRYPDGRQVMKRVVGLPGEKIQMLREGKILINGSAVEPPAQLDFLSYFPFGNLIAQKTVDCGEGYFVLGDYSRDSDDSRFNGPVPPEEIIGRAWVILGPAGRRGFVNQ